MIYKNRLAATVILLVIIIFGQSFTLMQDDDKPKNLKVLSKDMTDKQVVDLMKIVSRSLGVKCGFCHQKIEGGEHPKFDFASDAKPEKEAAREMMKMTNDINNKYIDRIGEGHFERITCVSCHMGRTKPVVNVDSLQAMTPQPPPAPQSPVAPAADSTIH